MADPESGEIHAAGAVMWRAGEEGIETALVHRPRYDDWSFPKGKAFAGEHVLLTAVREVAEETGIRVALGRRLATTQYPTSGGPKRVDYWAARPASPGTFTQMAWDVDDIHAVVGELHSRGVVFEEHDLPGLTTINGIAYVEGNYPSKGGTGERAAWFKDSEGNLFGIGEPVN